MPLILICVLLFGAWFSYQYKHNVSKNDHKSEDFWKKEQEANFTRRKSMDDINYITVGEDELPECPENAGSEALRIHNEIAELLKNPVADLSDYTNTELKLKYGAPNFDALAAADNNFTALVRKLTTYGTELQKADCRDELRRVYALARRIGAATSGLTLAAAESYALEGNQKAIEELIGNAEAEKPDSKLTEDLRRILTKCINGDSADTSDEVSEQISSLLNEIDPKN